MKSQGANEIQARKRGEQKEQENENVIKRQR
jgi:hypothetical protein